jgi:hypothetical protein
VEPPGKDSAAGGTPAPLPPPGKDSTAGGTPAPLPPPGKELLSLPAHTGVATGTSTPRPSGAHLGAATGSSTPHLLRSSPRRRRGSSISARPWFRPCAYPPFVDPSSSTLLLICNLAQTRWVATHDRIRPRMWVTHDLAGGCCG